MELSLVCLYLFTKFIGVCTCVCGQRAAIWNWASLFTVGPWDWTQVLGLAWQCLTRWTTLPVLFLIWWLLSLFPLCRNLEYSYFWSLWEGLWDGKTKGKQGWFWWWFQRAQGQHLVLAGQCVETTDPHLFPSTVWALHCGMIAAHIQGACFVCSKLFLTHPEMQPEVWLISEVSLSSWLKINH